MNSPENPSLDELHSNLIHDTALEYVREVAGITVNNKAIICGKQLVVLVMCLPETNTRKQLEALLAVQNEVADAAKEIGLGEQEKSKLPPFGWSSKVFRNVVSISAAAVRPSGFYTVDRLINGLIDGSVTIAPSKPH